MFCSYVPGFALDIGLDLVIGVFCINNSNGVFVLVLRGSYFILGFSMRYRNISGFDLNLIPLGLKMYVSHLPAVFPPIRCIDFFIQPNGSSHS